MLEVIGGALLAATVMLVFVGVALMSTHLLSVREDVLLACAVVVGGGIGLALITGVLS